MWQAQRGQLLGLVAPPWESLLCLESVQYSTVTLAAYFQLENVYVMCWYPLLALCCCFAALEASRRRADSADIIVIHSREEVGGQQVTQVTCPVCTLKSDLVMPNIGAGQEAFTNCAACGTKLVLTPQQMIVVPTAVAVDAV